jgi:hypothetical protein
LILSGEKCTKNEKNILKNEIKTTFEGGFMARSKVVFILSKLENEGVRMLSCR